MVPHSRGTKDARLSIGAGVPYRVALLCVTTPWQSRLVHDATGRVQPWDAGTKQPRWCQAPTGGTSTNSTRGWCAHQPGGAPRAVRNGEVQYGE